MSRQTKVCDSCGLQIVFLSKRSVWVHVKKGQDHAPVPVDKR